MGEFDMAFRGFHSGAAPGLHEMRCESVKGLPMHGRGGCPAHSLREVQTPDGSGAAAPWRLSHGRAGLDAFGAPHAQTSLVRSGCVLHSP